MGRARVEETADTYLFLSYCHCISGATALQLFCLHLRCIAMIDHLMFDTREDY